MARTLHYWDSDVFIGWLAAETDKEPHCRGTIQHAEAGKLTIVTSALTLAEVINLKGHKKLPREVDEKVKGFFAQPYISVRILDRRLAEAARDLVWNHGIKPKDAVHVATAIDMRVEHLATFDKDLHKLSGTIGSPMTLGPPNLAEQASLFGETTESESEDEGADPFL